MGFADTNQYIVSKMTTHKKGRASIEALPYINRPIGGVDLIAYWMKLCRSILLGYSLQDAMAVRPLMHRLTK